MATKIVPRRNGAAGLLVQYLALGTQETEIKRRRSTLKGDLVALAEQQHEEDPEKGHLIHTLPEPVVVDGRTYSGFMKQRKVSQAFLEDEAEALCQEKGFDLDEYTTRYVDQDKIVRLYAEDKITEDEFARLHENTVTWAFVPVKE